jgi:hypothetical protein
MALIYDGNIILGEDLMKIPLNVSIPHHHDLKANAGGIKN